MTTLQAPWTSEFWNEVLFTYGEWNIQAMVDKGGVRQVFWGRHNVCNGSITGVSDPHSHYACNNCCEIMTPEEEQVLRNAMHMLQETVVVKEPTIVGLSKTTYTMLKG